MRPFNNYDLPGMPKVVAWNPVVMRCPGCGLDEDPEFHHGLAAKRCWHLRACDMHAMNSRIPPWKREIKAGDRPAEVDADECRAATRARGPRVYATQFMGDIGQLSRAKQELILGATMGMPGNIFLLLTKWPQFLQGLEWPENVWIGCSVTCQADANRRIPELFKVHGHHWWVSAEPLIGPLDLERVMFTENRHTPEAVCVLGERHATAFGTDYGRINDVQFVACGPETGRGVQIDTDIHAAVAGVAVQCARHGVPFYDKRAPDGGGMGLGRFTRREWPREWIEVMSAR